MNKSDLNHRTLLAIHRSPAQIPSLCCVCQKPLGKGVGVVTMPDGDMLAMCAKCGETSELKIVQPWIPEPTKAAGVPLTPKPAHDPTLQFFVKCEPPTITAQQKGVTIKGGKPRFYTKKAVKDATRTLKLAFAPFMPRAPMTGPLSLTLEFVYPWLKGQAKEQKKYLRYQIDTRPDADNISKNCCDLMTEMGFWEDDSQICSLTIRKYRGDQPGIAVRLMPEAHVLRL